MSRFTLAIDTETGGLNPDQADVITLYMAMLDEDLKLVDELDLLLKPEDRLPNAEAGALKVNKINLQEHLENPQTVTYSEANKKIVAFIKKYLKKNGRYSNITPLGQNVSFDLSFINKYLVDKNEWNSLIHYGVKDTKTYIDLFKDAGLVPPTLGRLGDIAEYFKIPFANAHTAKADTLVCIEVYKKILEMLKSKKEGSAQVDLISLLESE